VEPFVALMRRYCIDYTNSHDQTVCDEIMDDGYVVHISGFDLARDAAYKPAVKIVFERFPGLGLVVHELVTNGDKLAMRFSEHGAAPGHGGRLAVWAGIGVYSWDGRRLRENWVEQDFLAQERQLSGEEPAPALEPPHCDPWVSTRAEPSDPEAMETARAWLAKGDLRAAPEVVIDSSWYRALEPSPVEVESVAVNDLFSAGDRVAFHVSYHGRYRGGIPGVADPLRGEEMTLRCVGIARVAGGAVREVRAVTDRLGARAALLGRSR
jgi:predicted ester cyclase